MKEIKFNIEATESVLRGVNIVSDAVKSTYGPGGKNVIIDIEGDVPHITKDGVTVANSIELEDNFESIGVKLIQGVATKTLKDVGDGTSTATILTQELINLGIKELQFGVNSFKLREGINIAVNEIKEELKNSSVLINTDTSKIRDVALVSTNGDAKISNLLYEIFSQLGKDGVVNIDNSTSLETYFEITEGIKVKSGYDNPLFSKGESKIIFNKPRVYISKDTINQMTSLVPILREIQEKKEPLIIIAPDINRDILNTLMVNNYQGTLQVVYIKLPASSKIQKEQLTDLSIVIGNKFNLNTSTSGYLEQAVIEQYSTSFIALEKNHKDIEVLKDDIRKEITPINSFEDIKLKERIANLSGKIATIYLSASSDMELKEKKDKIDDAIHAVKAALDEGIVEGAGITLKKVSEQVCDRLLQSCNDTGIRVGISLIKEVSKVPFNLLNRTKENKDNILDPVKVVYTALENAASIAGLFLTTNCIIANKK